MVTFGKMRSNEFHIIVVESISIGWLDEAIDNKVTKLWWYDMRKDERQGWPGEIKIVCTISRWSSVG